MFINLGRGSIISRDEIISSLDKNLISCAVLDVFHEEPLPPSDPLWSHPKVFVTPHIAAETRDVDLAELFVQNLALFENNQRLMNEIEWGSDY
jgi:glyoxylate/hydroxypyruvate reductase A